VRRQALRQVASEFIARWLSITYCIRDQSFVAAFIRPRKDYGFSNSFMLPECGFNLSNFNSKTPDLYLIIYPAHELNRTGMLLSNDVAGSIEPRARLGAKRIRYELLRRLAGPAEVSARHIPAAYAQLAGKPRRHWLEITIQDVCLCVSEWPAE